jgi:bisphosphoglycerate-independent phosphoglycerate mutase (AlkP superfamily)
VKKAYDYMTGATNCQQFRSARKAIQHYCDDPQWSDQTGDEFILPTQIVDEFPRKMENHDSVIFFISS